MSARRGKKRGTGTPARAERRRWIVDSISEGIARIEEDGARILHVPSWMLPDEARAGSVLSVTRDAADDRVLLRIALDPAAEAEALDRSRRQVERATGDEGGDVVL